MHFKDNVIPSTIRSRLQVKQLVLSSFIMNVWFPSGKHVEFHYA